MITDDEQRQNCQSVTRKIGDPLYTTFQKIFTIIRIFLKSEAPKAPGLFTFVHRGGLDHFVVFPLLGISGSDFSTLDIVSVLASLLFMVEA